MDAAYLQREVGGALSKGLAAVTTAHPHDPIAYLGQWLLQYVKNQAQEKEVLFINIHSFSYSSLFSLPSNSCAVIVIAQVLQCNQLREPSITLLYYPSLLPQALHFTLFI